MEFIEKGIPLWKITIWDKRFNNVDNEWQPKTIKYNYLLSDELNSIKSEYGDVRILYTGKEVGYTTEELAGKNLSEGEIVSIPWGGIPSVKYYKGKFVTGDNRIATSSDVNRLTNKYLYYFLRGNIHEVASYYRGASLKHPNMKDILKMKISFPSIDIQEKICTQLDILESIIALRQKELLELDRLIRARFVEMFGGMVLNTNVWDKYQLGDLCDVRDGTHDSPQYYNEGYPLVTSKNVSGGIINLKDCNLICEDDYQKINQRSKVDYGDILMPMIGTVGNPVIVDLDPQFAIKNVALIKFRKESKVLNSFVKVLLESDYFDNTVISKVRGGTQKFISLSDIRKLEICLPPIEVQKSFEVFTNQVNKSKVKVQRALDEAQLLFDSLMQKYFG